MEHIAMSLITVGLVRKSYYDCDVFSYIMKLGGLNAAEYHLLEQPGSPSLRNTKCNFGFYSFEIKIKEDENGNAAPVHRVSPLLSLFKSWGYSLTSYDKFLNPNVNPPEEKECENLLFQWTLEK